jgi:hypothetical protein
MLKFPPILCQGAPNYFSWVIWSKEKKPVLNHFNNYVSLSRFQSPHFPNMEVRPAAFPKLSIVTQLTCIWGVPAPNTKMWKLTTMKDFSWFFYHRNVTKDDTLKYVMLWLRFLVVSLNPTRHMQGEYPRLATSFNIPSNSFYTNHPNSMLYNLSNWKCC